MNETAISIQRTALFAGALAAGGVLFALYQFARPFTDTAETMASTAWLTSHLFAVVGFVLIGLGLLGVYLRLQPTPGEGWALRAVVAGGLGAGAALPYYGAETFGLRLIAQRALHDGDPSLLALAEEFHAAPLESTWFALGLLLLGLAGVAAALAVARSTVMHAWSAAPLALGYALLIPQFFTPQPVRMVHGALVALGALWLAVELWRARSRTAAPPVETPRR
jgi:hypothetical protein